MSAEESITALEKMEAENNQLKAKLSESEAKVASLEVRFCSHALSTRASSSPHALSLALVCCCRACYARSESSRVHRRRLRRVADWRSRLSISA